MKIFVIDVESGNLRSLENAIENLGHSVSYIRTADECIAARSSADRVILPGVGNFGHFMERLDTLGLRDPIRNLLITGKPLMGICVGLQVLFEASQESPQHKGLGFIQGELVRFDPTTKPVPHMGWNNPVTTNNTPVYTMQALHKYYFVHSYAFMTPSDNHALENWTVVHAKYGDQVFAAALACKKVLATQFHPEKSGSAGLAVLKAFLDQSPTAEYRSGGVVPPPGLSKRIIACLDVRSNDAGDLVVTKGDQYDVRHKEAGQVRNLGKPVELATRYYTQGADEITFLNITSFRNSPVKDLPMLQVLRQASKSIFVPLTIGGGIKDTLDPETNQMVSALDIASLYFASGADKVSIGGDAVIAAEAFYARGQVADGTSPMETISRAYGAQAVVVSVDPKRVYVKRPSDVSHHTFKTRFPGPAGEEYVWYQCSIKGGREFRDLGAYELCKAVQAMGAGELLVNCIDKDGSNSGFDLELINDIKAAVTIPVIASSGAGVPDHFFEVFDKTTTDAALGAGMFHRSEYTVESVKSHLLQKGLNVRV